MIGSKVKCDECQNDFEVINPNLFPCPDCFALISKRAEVCPKCGAPLTEKNLSSDATDISTEKNIAIYRPSALNYLPQVIFGVLTIPLVIGIVVLICIIIEIKCTTYELTNFRIIVRRGWIAKQHNEIWIKDMRGVNLIQSFWQRIIGIGDVSIGTAASCDTEIKITGIADPSELVTQINSLRH